MASSAVSHCSIQSSLSSISSSMPQSPVNCGISHSAGFGDPTDLGGCVTNVDICDATYSIGDLEKKSYCVGMSEAPVAEERKLDVQTLKPCYSTRSLLSNDGHRPPTELSSSVNLKERFPLHLILTHQEMQILATKCNKPLRTTNNFGFEEFDILVTDVVDSCHFWANVDDKVRCLLSCYCLFYPLYLTYYYLFELGTHECCRSKGFSGQKNKFIPACLRVWDQKVIGCR